MRSKHVMVATLLAACALAIALPAASAVEVNAPAAGQTYTWHVRATNGQVEWWTNDFTSHGNVSFTVPGKITFTLGGQHPNDELWSNITGNVWYGNVTGWTEPVAGATLEANWTIVNCSSTETGFALTFSASFFEGWNTVVSWPAGLLAPGNWTLNQAILATRASETNITTSQSGGVFTVVVNQDAQQTTMEYDMATGVLLYANTGFGDYQLEIILDGYNRGGFIPGYGPVLVVMVTVATLAIVARGARRDNRA